MASDFCFFCGTEGPIVCDSPKCQQHDKETREWERSEYCRKVRAGVWSAFRDRCKCDGNWGLNRCQRWWYVLKLLICVVSRLSYHGDKCYPDCVEVGCFHSAKLYAGWEADWIRVGHGLFTGWWFDLHHDGEWEM
jgi:hypothetical protein